ncbi:MAG: T9SS type A sorting domain-containing protein [Bacteroidota bacterium]
MTDLKRDVIVADQHTHQAKIMKMINFQNISSLTFAASLVFLSFTSTAHGQFTENAKYVTNTGLLTFMDLSGPIVNSNLLTTNRYLPGSNILYRDVYDLGDDESDLIALYDDIGSASMQFFNIDFTSDLDVSNDAIFIHRSKQYNTFGVNSSFAATWDRNYEQPTTPDPTCSAGLIVGGNCYYTCGQREYSPGAAYSLKKFQDPNSSSSSGNIGSLFSAFQAPPRCTGGLPDPRFPSVLNSGSLKFSYYNGTRQLPLPQGDKIHMRAGAQIGELGLHLYGSGTTNMSAGQAAYDYMFIDTNVFYYRDSNINLSVNNSANHPDGINFIASELSTIFIKFPGDAWYEKYTKNTTSHWCVGCAYSWNTPADIVVTSKDGSTGQFRLYYDVDFDEFYVAPVNFQTGLKQMFGVRTSPILDAQLVSQNYPSSSKSEQGNRTTTSTTDDNTMELSHHDELHLSMSNPSRDYLTYHIQTPYTTPLTFHIIDIRGRIVATVSRSPATSSMTSRHDIRDLSPGVYLARVAHEDRVATRMFTVSR